MKYLHREVARRSNRETRRINHFFGGRYKWTVVSDERYFWNAVKYIFRNPIRAGLCKKVEDYKFSSLNSISNDFKWIMTDHFNNRKKSIELDYDWLNEEYSIEANACIRLALRRRTFEIPRNSVGRDNILDVPRIKKGTVT